VSRHDWHRAWCLSGDGVSLVLAQRGEELPEAVHWGAPLSPAEDPLAFALARRRAVCGGTFDVLPPLSLLPEEGRGAQAVPGLSLSAPDGTGWLTAFRVAAVDHGSDRITIEAREDGLALTLSLVFEGAVLVAHAVLANTGATPLLVARFAAPALPLPEHSGSLVTFGGHWTGEFRETHHALAPGEIVREARGGRTGHEHFPAALLLAPGATANAGEAHAVHLAWSGGHTMTCEELSDGRRQIQFGPLLRPGEIILAPGGTLRTPTLYAAYSDAGRSGIAQRLHARVRDLIGHQRRPRPVTCNSWEAVYFAHEPERLAALAGEAARLGAERFVLDDGWFGRRDDDTTSLGDWTVDRRKWPDGLAPLIDTVHRLGMEFGIWIEPEMVSEESDLCRAHPDWLLGDPRRPPLPGRNQHVLDLARPEVADHVFAQIDALLSEHSIGSVKWDHNRALSAAAGADGRAGYVRQSEAFLALLDRLIAAHPAVEFESCASGGGRIDYQVLARAGRVWLSDSNDALERMRMQNTAALFLPPEVVGSHVGPRRCHTSGRVLPMTTRAYVAAARHMGFEFDLAELTEDERDTLARAVALHKSWRPLLAGGAFHLLDLDEPNAFGEVIVAGGRFVAFLSFVEAPARASTRPVRLAGLDAAARYRVRLANPEAVDARLSRRFSSPLLAPDGLLLSGAALCRAGIVLPIHAPGTVFVLEGEAVA